LLGEGAEADHHAGLAVLEELERAVGAVGLARIHLRHAVAVREVGEEREGAGVRLAVDRPSVAGLPVTAAVPHPDRPLGLRLLGTERQGVADRAAAERLDLLRGLHELVPRLRRRGDPGLREAGPVVEELGRAAW